MLTFIKLGGSLITDKRVEASYRAEVTTRIANEIAAALQAAPQQLLIGHGSGSFGHFAAQRHNTMRGVHTPSEWRGFVEVASAAARLNHLVTETLHERHIPAWRIQPSASARCEDGRLVEMTLHPIQTALEKGLIPLVYGDVALDDVRGGTIISTETILSYLARHLPVKQILLLGEVPGVYDVDDKVIAEITPGNAVDYESALGGSAGTDVTGGMLSKVQDMLALVGQQNLQIRIMDGTEPGLLRDTLAGDATPGTLIHQG